MPFIGATIGRYTPEAAEAVRIMIAAGVDVNEASPDGLLPLSDAIAAENETVVKMLLEAGADPLLRPKHSDMGDLRSAVELADQLPRTAGSIRIQEMVRSAVAARAGRK